MHDLTDSNSNFFLFLYWQLFSFKVLTITFKLLQTITFSIMIQQNMIILH